MNPRLSGHQTCAVAKNNPTRSALPLTLTLTHAVDTSLTLPNWVLGEFGATLPSMTVPIWVLGEFGTTLPGGTQADVGTRQGCGLFWYSRFWRSRYWCGRSVPSGALWKSPVMEMLLWFGLPDITGNASDQANLLLV